MKSECKHNPERLNNGRQKTTHDFQVENIDEIYFVVCQNSDDSGRCRVSLSHPVTTNFMSHVTEESLTRITTALIEKTDWSPAETSLVEYLKKEVF